MLRSSPVICAVDAIGVLVQWVSHMFWHLEAPSTAARRIARARFRDIENEDEEESLTSLEKNVPFRMVVFVFGALPTAIKLFASSGIAWLKVWATMYLGSWAVLELLIGVLAADERHRSNRGKTLAAHLASAAQMKWKHVRDAWAICAITAHIVLLGLSTTFLLLIGMRSSATFAAGLHCALQTACALILWPMFLDGDHLFDGSSEPEVAVVLTGGFISLSSVTTLVGPPRDEKFFEFVLFLVSLLGGGLLIAGGFLMGSWRDFTRRILSKLHARTNLSLSFVIPFILNGYSLYLYFFWKYSPEGTSIPQWTRWLG